MPRPVVVQKFEQMFRASGRTATKLGCPPTDIEKVKWLYEVLTILDSKAGALLAFDGLLLAAEALMYDKLSEHFVLLRPYTLVLIFFTLAAALVCLLVAQVSYDFLGKIALEDYDNTAEIDGLGKAVEIRTKRLGVAWGLSVTTVVIFMVLVAAALLKG